MYAFHIFNHTKKSFQFAMFGKRVRISTWRLLFLLVIESVHIGWPNAITGQIEKKT